mgnify:CR=1 FL=1
MKTVPERLEDFIQSAYNLKDYVGHASWQRMLLAFLGVASPETAMAIRDLGGHSPTQWDEYRDRQVGYLEALVIELLPGA